MIDEDLIGEEALRAGIEASKRGDNADAIRLLEVGLRQQTARAEFWALLGELYAREEQYASAVAALERATQLDPTSASAHSALGRIFEEIGRLDDAERAFRKAIQIGPTASRYVLLADVQRMLGRPADAEVSLSAALAMTPDDEDALFNLAVLRRQDDPAYSVSLFQGVIELNPRSAAALRELGFELLKQGDPDRAQELLERSLELNPRQPWAYIYLAEVHRSNVSMREAEDAFVAACEVAPLAAFPQYLLARFYEEQGRREEAEKHFRRAAATDEKDVDALFQLGRFLIGARQVAEGRTWLERALQLEPDHAGAREEMRRLLGEQGFA